VTNLGKTICKHGTPTEDRCLLCSDEPITAEDIKKAEGSDEI
jgi:hypothetical protein